LNRLSNGRSALSLNHEKNFPKKAGVKNAHQVAEAEISTNEDQST